MPTGFKLITIWCWIQLIFASVVLLGSWHIGALDKVPVTFKAFTYTIIFTSMIYQIGLIVAIYFESKTIIKPAVGFLILSFLFSIFSFFIARSGAYFYMLADAVILIYLYFNRKYFT